MSNITIITSSPNQKIITVNKVAHTKNAENTYSMFDTNAVIEAANNLSDRAFKVYTAINLNKDGYTFALSSVDINNRTGFSEKKYRAAVKELIEKGYLTLSTERKNLYYFNEKRENISTSCVDTSYKHITKQLNDQKVSTNVIIDYEDDYFEDDNIIVSDGITYYKSDYSNYQTDNSTDHFGKYRHHEIASKYNITPNSEGDLPF